MLPVQREAQAKTFGMASKPPNQLDPMERQIVLALKAERERQEISAAELAKKIGVSRSAITHVEADRCRPTLWLVIKIAQGLNLKLRKILESTHK